MKAEFWCSRRIGVEVVEKDKRLDPFANVARTDQSGNTPCRCPRVRSAICREVSSARFGSVNTALVFIFVSPKGLAVSKRQSSTLDPVQQGNEFIVPQVDNHRVKDSRMIAGTGLVSRTNTWVATAQAMVNSSHRAPIEASRNEQRTAPISFLRVASAPDVEGILAAFPCASVAKLRLPSWSTCRQHRIGQWVSASRTGLVEVIRRGRSARSRPGFDRRPVARIHHGLCVATHVFVLDTSRSAIILGVLNAVLFYLRHDELVALLHRVKR